MRRTVPTLWLSVSGLFAACIIAQAADMTSPNFKNFDSSFAPAAFSGTSPNFSIDASIEPIVDVSQSANFTILHGVPLKDASVTPPPPVPPPSGGGGGGGGGGAFLPSTATTSATTTRPTAGTALPPTLDYRSPTFLSHQMLRGNRAASTDTVTVNGSANGVSLLPGTGWQRDLPLFVGYNDIRVQSTDKTGATSPVIGGQIERMLIGDATRTKGPTLHHVVDDADLSLMTRSWKRYDFYSDFNEDTFIDDADLSLLVSHWGLTADY